MVVVMVSMRPLRRRRKIGLQLAECGLRSAEIARLQRRPKRGKIALRGQLGGAAGRRQFGQIGISLPRPGEVTRLQGLRDLREVLLHAAADTVEDARLVDLGPNGRCDA